MAIDKTVVIQGDGYKLRGRMYGKGNPTDPRPALLFLSGWNPGTQSWTTNDIQAAYCAWKLTIVCMTIALRGMGSVGNIKALTRADFLKDVIAGYDYLTEREGVDKERISVVGESFGAYLACLLSTQRAVTSLALRVPTDFPDEGFDDIPQEKFAGLLSQKWKKQEHQFAESRALQGLHDFQGEVLLVAAELDEFVPYQTTTNYLKAANELAKVNYIMMRGARHALINPIKLYQFMNLQSEWLRTHI
jgi:dienelactone hydrolase